MKHFLALPALLRPALLLASASQHAFSVNDDLLAFPQYRVTFPDDYVTENEAQRRIQSEIDSHNKDAPASSDSGQEQQQLGHYIPPDNSDSTGDASDRLSTKDASPTTPTTYETLILHGRPYLCSIPVIAPSSQSDNDTASAEAAAAELAEAERELARATDRGWELLSGMRGNCVFFISGWWSYRFCYGQGVKQFHQLPPGRGVPMHPPVEDPTVEGFYLGNYAKKEKDDVAAEKPEVPVAGQDEEQSEVQKALDVSEGSDTATRRKASRHSQDGELVQRGESRYLVQHLGGGTVCDLTGEERRIEVQFHCNPQSADRISLIKETSICAYLMVVQTPRLCNDVAFQPPQKDHPNIISCSPIVAEDEVADFEVEVELFHTLEQEAAKIEADFAAEAAASGDNVPLLRPIVGDLEVGAHNLIPPGKSIEKSAILGGGKETYVDTVASSDGKALSSDDMKKLGLGDARAVDALKKEIEKISKGRTWKLDVVDTPRGREFRAIFDHDDDGEEKVVGEKGQKGDKKANGGSDGTGKDQDKEQDGEKQEGSQEEYFEKEEL